jgi:hypothetical protein
LRHIWLGINANEPFSVCFKTLDFEAAFVEAGGASEKFFRGSRKPVYRKGNSTISLVGAVKE